MDHAQARDTLVRHGFREVHTHATWWLARRDPVVAHVLFDHATGGYSVVLVRVYGPETLVPQFATGEFSEQWALERTLSDLLRAPEAAAPVVPVTNRAEVERFRLGALSQQGLHAMWLDRYADCPLGECVEDLVRRCAEGDRPALNRAVAKMRRDGV